MSRQWHRWCPCSSRGRCPGCGLPECRGFCPCPRVGSHERHTLPPEAQLRHNCFLGVGMSGSLCHGRTPTRNLIPELHLRHLRLHALHDYRLPNRLGTAPHKLPALHYTSMLRVIMMVVGLSVGRSVYSAWLCRIAATNAASACALLLSFTTMCPNPMLLELSRAPRQRSRLYRLRAHHISTSNQPGPQRVPADPLQALPGSPHGAAQPADRMAVASQHITTVQRELLAIDCCKRGRMRRPAAPPQRDNPSAACGARTELACPPPPMGPTPCVDGGFAKTARFTRFATDAPVTR